MIYRLSLPKPSEELIALVKYHASKSSVNMDTVRWHQHIQKPTVNCAAGTFFSVPAVTNLAKIEFQSYFKTEVFPVIGIIDNLSPASLASYPPHTDRIRTIGINFYIELGGDNVQTIFYQEHDDINDAIGGNVLPYDKVSIESSIKFLTDEWYVIDTRRYHSVENIETTRLLLTLSFLEHDFVIFKDLVLSTGIEPVFTT